MKKIIYNHSSTIPNYVIRNTNTEKFIAYIQHKDFRFEHFGIRHDKIYYGLDYPFEKTVLPIDIKGISPAIRYFTVKEVNFFSTETFVRIAKPTRFLGFQKSEFLDEITIYQYEYSESYLLKVFSKVDLHLDIDTIMKNYRQTMEDLEKKNFFLNKQPNPIINVPVNIPNLQPSPTQQNSSIFSPTFSFVGGDVQNSTSLTLNTTSSSNSVSLVNDTVSTSASEYTLTEEELRIVLNDTILNKVYDEYGEYFYRAVNSLFEDIKEFCWNNILSKNIIKEIKSTVDIDSSNDLLNELVERVFWETYSYGVVELDVFKDFIFYGDFLKLDLANKIDNSKDKETIIDNSKDKETIIDNSKDKETIIDNSKDKETIIDNSKDLKEELLETETYSVDSSVGEISTEDILRQTLGIKILVKIQKDFGEKAYDAAFELFVENPKFLFTEFLGPKFTKEALSIISDGDDFTENFLLEAIRNVFRLLYNESIFKEKVDKSNNLVTSVTDKQETANIINVSSTSDSTADSKEILDAAIETITQNCSTNMNIFYFSGTFFQIAYAFYVRYKFNKKYKIVTFNQLSRKILGKKKSTIIFQRFGKETAFKAVCLKVTR